MPYVMFGTREEFDAWHVSKCGDEGIPRPGKNANSGEYDVDAQWTTAWVEPVYVKGGVAAPFTQEEIDADPWLKRLPTVEPVKVEGEFGETVDKTDAVEFTWQKEVPDSYTIDGKTYTRTPKASEPVVKETTTTPKVK
jgi:hypothetical protein